MSRYILLTAERLPQKVPARPPDQLLNSFCSVLHYDIRPCEREQNQLKNETMKSHLVPPRELDLTLPLSSANDGDQIIAIVFI